MPTVLERLAALAAQPQGQGRGHLERVPINDEAWVCDTCGFVMWAGHTDDGTDGYSCPACFESAVAPLLPDLLALARFCQHMDFECEESVDFLCREAVNVPREQWCEPCGAAAARDALFGKENRRG